MDKVTKKEFVDFINNYPKSLTRYNQTIADRIDFKTKDGQLIAKIQMVDDSYWINKGNDLKIQSY